MAKVQFKAKVQNVVNMDGSPAYSYIQVPELGRKHCDMNAFRSHPKIGAYANSDMFPSILARQSLALLGSKMLKIDSIPAGVNVDLSGFLAVVSFDL